MAEKRQKNQEEKIIHHLSEARTAAADPEGKAKIGLLLYFDRSVR